MTSGRIQNCLMTIYGLFITNTSGFYTGYKGCWLDNNNGQASALSPGMNYDPHGMSIQPCVMYCRIYGYKYSGIVNGTTCLCGNNENYNHNGGTGDLPCNIKCPSNNAEFCGGQDYISVYATGTCPTVTLVGGAIMAERHGGIIGHLTVTRHAYFKCDDGKYLIGNASIQCVDNPDNKFSAKWNSGAPICRDIEGFKGCYKDDVERMFSWQDKLELYKTMTVSRCIDHCLTKGYRYAGLQHAFECWCGQENINYAALGMSNNCTMYCSGDYTQTCGGQMAMSVYETSVCPDYPAHEYNGGYVHQTGHHYGSIMTFECYDGKRLTGSRILTCKRISQHGSFQLDWSETYPACKDIPSYVGCFDTSPQNIASFDDPYLRIDDRTNMTIWRCVDHCKARNHTYASLRHGYECNCGQGVDISAVQRKVCTAHCSGDASTVCGDSDAMSIYEAIPPIVRQTSTQSSITSNGGSTTSILQNTTILYTREKDEQTQNTKQHTYVYIDADRSWMNLELSHLLVIVFVSFGVLLIVIFLLIFFIKRKSSRICTRLCLLKKPKDSHSPHITSNEPRNEPLSEITEIRMEEETCTPVFDLQMSPNGAYLVFHNDHSLTSTPKMSHKVKSCINKGQCILGTESSNELSNNGDGRTITSDRLKLLKNMQLAGNTPVKIDHNDPKF